MKDLKVMTHEGLVAEAAAFAAAHAGAAWEMLPAKRGGRRTRGGPARVGLLECGDAQLRAFLARARRAEAAWLRADMRRAAAAAGGDLELLRDALAVLRATIAAWHDKARSARIREFCTYLRGERRATPPMSYFLRSPDPSRRPSPRAARRTAATRRRGATETERWLNLIIGSPEAAEGGKL